MKLILRFALFFFVSLDFFATAIVAMDFSPQEQDTSIDSLIASEEATNMDHSSDDSEVGQSEARVTRPWAVGFGLGEESPHESMSLRVLKTLTTLNAASVSLGFGDHQSTEQNEGEAWFENKAKVIGLSARYLWWPSPEFPFALTLTLSAQRVSGKVKSQTAPAGDYVISMVYAASGLTMTHNFSSGLWLQWNLLSINYGKSLTGRYTNLTGQQMRSVRKSLDGLRITGVANLTLGYAF